MVVRFVRVIRVPACARVSRVCPGSPRCLFTGCAAFQGAGRGRGEPLAENEPVPGHMASVFSALCVVASALEGDSCARELLSPVLLCLLRLLVPARSAILQLRLVLTCRVFIA